MSRIITPRDTITISIDNTQSPAKVEMAISRDLPMQYVTIILANLIAQVQARSMPSNFVRSTNNIQEEKQDNGPTT